MFNDLSSTASWSMGVTIVLVVFCVLYLIMLRLAFVRARGSSEERPVSVVCVVAFFLGLFLAAFLLLSPINTIARTQLFSLHMAQAVALTTVCAPLIIAGWPGTRAARITRVMFEPVNSPLLASPTRDSRATRGTMSLLWHVWRLWPACPMGARIGRDG